MVPAPQKRKQKRKRKSKGKKSPRIPLKFGTADRFVAVRRLLEDSGYTPAHICERLGLNSVFELETLREGPLGVDDLRNGADLLTWLFLGAERVERARASRLLSDSGLATLAELGLIEAAPEAAQLQATVLLYPVDSLYLASDLPIDRADGSPTSFPDAVYPPLTASAGWFLSMLPNTPCRNFLELCSGTGVAALLASRAAEKTCAVDITERSTVFARFNARLNEIPNFRALRGDLYDPVEGETFDRIVAHPPYMPAGTNARIFRDGGPDGEAVTRGVFAGLAEHLSPGGRLYVTAILSDRRGQPVEMRVREMLGATGAECDVAVVTIKGLHPMVHYGAELWKGTATAQEVEPQLAYLRPLGIERMLLCTVVVQRPESPRSPFTARRVAGQGSNRESLEWLLRWEVAATDPDLEAQLGRGVPRTTGACELLAAHRMHREGWQPVGYWLKNESPFEAQVACGAWVAEFLQRCDGERSSLTLLEDMKSEGTVPADASERDFLTMVRGLAADGFLEFDGL